MTGYIDPTKETFASFRESDRPGPIHMLNLVRFRDQAAYPEGHENANRTMTGKDAYSAYGRASGPVFARVGGSIIWRGDMTTMLIGPENEHWDTSFIARYPHAGAFLEMVTDPIYRLAVVHRQAAVLTSRLIRHAGFEGDQDGHFHAANSN